MRVEILDGPLTPYSEIELHQNTHLQEGSFGACSVFVGSMRDFNEDQNVQEMFLEHYPEMTQRYLEKLAREAEQKWEVTDILLMHRVGTVRPGDAIVLIAVWSAHRAESFASCRYLIEELKNRAPFWKKETSGDSSRWVEHNTPAE